MVDSFEEMLEKSFSMNAKKKIRTKIFFVRDGELDEVNKLLEKGARLISINPVSETVSGDYSSGGASAYIVLEL